MSAVCNNSQACDSNFMTQRSQELLPDSAIYKPTAKAHPSYECRQQALAEMSRDCQESSSQFHDNKIKELVAVVLKGKILFSVWGSCQGALEPLSVLALSSHVRKGISCKFGYCLCDSQSIPQALSLEKTSPTFIWVRSLPSQDYS